MAFRPPMAAYTTTPIGMRKLIAAKCRKFGQKSSPAFQCTSLPGWQYTEAMQLAEAELHMRSVSQPVTVGMRMQANR